MAARIAMMAITTSSSMSVNALCPRIAVTPLLLFEEWAPGLFRVGASLSRN
jgi:hypothetical protein